VILALATLAVAAPVRLDAVETRLSGRLRRAAALDAAGDVGAFRAAMPEPPPADGLSVVLLGDDADALVDRLDAMDISVEAVAGGAVQAFVPYGQLRAVAALPGVRLVREPMRARAKDVVTEGYAATMARDWHADGIDGTGAFVGIVDVGFNRLDTLGAELPADIETDFSRGRVTSSAHGTAVTEVVADFAPNARYLLATFSTEVELGEVLEEFTDAGVDVINGSIGFDNTAHADGESYVTSRVDAAVDAGAIYVAAAGNENERYRVGALAWAASGGVTLAGHDSTRAWTASGFAEVSFRWSEPFGAAGTDLDLVLYNDDGTECGRSDDPQGGTGDPYEIVYASGCSPVVDAVVEPGDPAVDPIGLEGYLYAPYGLDEADWTNTEDLTLPGDTRAGISVGALYADDTLPGYSSRGPTNDGRDKPDVVAPALVSTATYGALAFDGSSAAAPHVAGLAALWVSASRRHGQPGIFREWLRANARDLGDPGVDDAFGAGAIHADEAPAKTCGCATAGEGGGRASARGPRGTIEDDGAVGWVASGGLLLLAARRRA
jgi:hypothetical protein